MIPRRSSRTAFPWSSRTALQQKLTCLWIEANLAEEFDLARLARQVGLSKFDFHRLFTQATGMSPAKYQLTARPEASSRPMAVRRSTPRIRRSAAT